MVSPIEPDWERERPVKLWDPSRRLIHCVRRWQKASTSRSFFSPVVRRFWSLQHLFWMTITQCELQLTTSIGGGLHLPHPNGVVIHPAVIIGPNCTIMQQVTIGVGKANDVPVIGANVYIAPGAKLVGGITIGDFALIGMNAVVMKDVPAGGVAVGVPASVRIDPNRLKGPLSQ